MPDATGMADPMAAGIDQAIAGRVDVGVWIRRAAQDHNVRHTEAPIDVFATAASRLSDAGVALDDIELLLLALARNDIATDRQRSALHAAYLRQKS
jgi:hypothetical protein